VIGLEAAAGHPHLWRFRFLRPLRGHPSFRIQAPGDSNEEPEADFLAAPAGSQEHEAEGGAQESPPASGSAEDGSSLIRMASRRGHRCQRPMGRTTQWNLKAGRLEAEPVEEEQDPELLEGMLQTVLC